MSEKKRFMVRYLNDLEQLSPVGYSAGLHIRFASPLYFRSTYPPSWRTLYAEQNFALRDPLVFWGISKTGHIRWSDIALPDPFGIMGQARKFGLVYGAVVSTGKITSRTIVGAARSDREFTDTELDDLAALTAGLHDVAEPAEDLTPSMVEALRLVARGYLQHEAAKKLDISESALRAQLSMAQVKLGVNTTDEALRMAREYRLI
jgi:LuxR family transcriptional regulator